MPRIRSWTDEQLVLAVRDSFSYRAVIKSLGLIPAGGNYHQVKHRIQQLSIKVDHFTGKQWNKGKRYSLQPANITQYLTRDSLFQSHKLKIKLFQQGLKQPKCELCGWADISQDGRIPVELDHINGNHYDNSLENLRILCPNCHSLQSTHRGRNKKVRLVNLN